MKDVSGIDLKNVKLLVLSACQTVLSGNISGAEVYGFAYQFERSGVGNVLAHCGMLMIGPPPSS